MNFDTDFFNRLIGFLLFGLSWNILWTQELPIGKSGSETGIYIGNWAYLLGGILLVYSIYILYYEYTKEKKR